MSGDKEKYRRKIRKLLALAESSNPHESARAKEQAMAMMRIHEIGDGEVDVIDQPSIILPYKSLKSSDDILLTSVVVMAGVRAYFRIYSQARRYKTQVNFLGYKNGAELADYALDVLHRQMREAAASLKQEYPRLADRELEEYRRGFAVSAGKKLISLFGKRTSPEAAKARLLQDFGDPAPVVIRNPKGARDGATAVLLSEGFRSGERAVLNPAASHQHVPIAAISHEDAT